MPKKIYLLPVLLMSVLSFLSFQAPPDDLADCLVKVKSAWGEHCSECGTSTDTYIVYVMSKCKDKLDVMVGVQDKDSKIYKLSTFYGVIPSDTLRIFACKGSGKWLKWARKAGDPTFKFPTQSEVNEQYK